MIRLFLAVSVLAWAGYGIFCFINPGFLATSAGVTAASATGTIELRAMYGGLQIALGVMAAAALMHASLQRAVLLMFAVATGGLFVTRLLGAVMAGEFSSDYTLPALVFEAVYAVTALVLMRRT